jgi:Asp-tRNA(Asn)/Glu-tRNA(Gln) amidotransferase A subunit family amidase
MDDAAPNGHPAAIDLVELTVDQAQAGFASGAITSEALTQAFLDRIAEYNPHYNAIIFLNPDALADARAIDRRRAAGEALGPLAGVPVVVKDPMDMVGFPTTAGWSLLYSKTGGVDLMPATDSPVVARMRAAGAIILGKTNVPVLSHTGSHANGSWAGSTYNAAGREFLPGGSSAGTATAVAASLAVLGLAEETGGSIQNPASAQALVGIKPSFALVPNAGVMPLAGNRDVVGPIARCVRDAALTLDVLAGYTAEDPKTIAGVGHRPKGGYASRLHTEALRGKRIGLYGPGWRNQALSTEAAALYGRAKGELEAQGAVLVDDPFLNSGFAELRKPTLPLAEFDARGLESVPFDMQKYLERMGPDVALRSFAEFAAATAKEDAFGPSGVLGFMPNLPQFAACLADPGRPPDMSEFIAVKEAYLEIFDAVFARERLDALVFPQMRAALTPLHGTDTIHETTVGEINIAGLPGVTVPAGYYASAAPFGLIFVGRMWSEADLLAYAYAYEYATKHRQAPALQAG